MSWRPIKDVPKNIPLLCICERERIDGKLVQYFAVIYLDSVYGLRRDEYHQMHHPVCYMPLPDKPFSTGSDKNEPYVRKTDLIPEDVMPKHNFGTDNLKKYDPCE